MQWRRYLLQIFFVIEKNFALLKLSRVIGYLVLLALILLFSLMFLIMGKSKKHFSEYSETFIPEPFCSTRGTPLSKTDLCPNIENVSAQPENVRKAKKVKDGKDDDDDDNDDDDDDTDGDGTDGPNGTDDPGVGNDDDDDDNPWLISTRYPPYWSTSEPEDPDRPIYPPYWSTSQPEDPDRQIEPPDDSPSEPTTTEYMRPGEVPRDVLLFSPNNARIRKMLDVFEKSTLMKKVTGYADSSQMEHAYVSDKNLHKRVFAGLQFNDRLRNTTDLPDEIEITFRFPPLYTRNQWMTDKQKPFDFVDYKISNELGPDYLGTGFLALQHVITLLLISEQRDNKTLKSFRSIKNIDVPTVIMKKFPRAPALDARYSQIKYILLPYSLMLLAVCFMLFCASESAAYSVEEKNNQLRETMMIMGLSKWVNWLAWYIYWFLLSGIFLIVAVSILHFEVLLHCSNWIVIYLLYLLGVGASITFGFLMGSLFTTPAQAIAYMFLIVLSFYIWICMDRSESCIVLRSFCFLYAFYIAVRSIYRRELADKEIQWGNLWHRMAYEEYSDTLGFAMLMLLVDSILYFLLASYIEAIKPGEYGIPKPWYFIFTTDFWCGRCRHGSAVGPDSDATAANDPSSSFEKEPSDLPIGIQAVNLKKVYKKNVAVKDLTINFYENQIAVLLGHNGAGKTTTMSMLTGMIVPTSGTATVNGYDIRTETSKARTSLGYCPQTNIVFNNLSVKRNLRFFMGLKGMRYKQIDREVNRYLQILGLQEKKSTRVSKLSGGMKRKLCIAIALCADSKVILLDEPTAGIDPGSRRDVWDLLLSQKSGKTFIVSTHFMDEADILGDRIAILSDGHLQCCGSSFFLKKKFGAGYYLVIEKSSRCNTQAVTQLLARYIPNVQVKSDLNSELIYLLPDERTSSFSSLLSDLEKQEDNLGIISFGLSQTTMYDVFVKVGVSGSSQKNGNPTGKSKSQTVQTSGSIHYQKHTGCMLLLNQLLAFLFKKWLDTTRSWFVPLMQVLLTILAAVIAFLTFETEVHILALPLTFQKFPGLEVLIQQNVNSSNAINLVNSYKSLVDAKIKYVNDIDKTVLDTGFKDIDEARRKYVYGAKFEEDENRKVTITTYFDGDPYHASPISLALTLNAVYKNAMYCENCAIKFINHPFPDDPEKKGFGAQFYQETIRVPLVTMVFICLISAYFMYPVVTERATKFKQLQIISGVSVIFYWFATIFVDILWCLVLIAVYVICLVCLQASGYNITPDIDVFVVLWLYYICALLPFTYVIAFLFKDPTNAFATMILVYFCGLGFFFIGVMLTMLPDVYFNFKMVVNILPPVSMAFGIFESSYFYFRKINPVKNSFKCDELPNHLMDSCVKLRNKAIDIIKPQIYKLSYAPRPDRPLHNRPNSEEGPNVYARHSDENVDQRPPVEDQPRDDIRDKTLNCIGLGTQILYSCLAGLFLFVLLLLCETCCRRIRCAAKRQKANIRNEDEDVAAEKEMIRRIPPKDLPRIGDLVTKNLTKYYGKNLAVNGIGLVINGHECFGLLGQNGAGKTTTFQMLTGSIKASSGDAWIMGFNIKTKPYQVHRSMGYCPQADALHDVFTPKETIKIFLLIRGVSPSNCAYIMDSLADQLELTSHMNKSIRHLSGGNKKKVSAILAVLGDPAVMFLDEPTTGLDPGSRRHVWDIITKARDNGACIILSSHLMEECEALCTRVTIMVAGNMMCLGSLQHVKNKYSQGFVITVKVRKPARSTSVNTDEVERYMSQAFKNIILTRKNENYLTYHLPDKRTPWSQIFATMESAKGRPDIEDYSVAQCSLEEVFLTLTRNEHQ